MKLLGCVFGLLGWSALTCGLPAGEQVSLRGDHFEATLSRHTGRLISIARAPGANLLRYPVVVSIRDEVSGVSGKVQILAGPIQRLKVTPGSASFSQQLPDLTAETRFLAGRELVLEVKLQNRTSERRDVSVWFDWGGLPHDCQAFLPGVYPHPESQIGEERLYGYRSEGLPLVIPGATFFSRSARTGLTLLSPLATPVQPFQVRLRPESGPEVGRVNLRLEANGERQTQIFLALHEPDWRPGLAFIRDKYPEHFTAHNPKAVEINGPFLWSPTAPEEQVRQWHRQGVRWVEVHFTYPFLGKYFPEDASWVPAADDHWAWEKMRSAAGIPPSDAPFELVKRYLAEVLTPWETPRECAPSSVFCTSMASKH